ncbi:serine/threonine transporter SstT [uncultured Methanobrevibacter sp.]|uniref:serine/threonine transporter SstT n=1 Tax=uncultured Methanobrevibacter sp. TaxID=253161 RepID=UPI0025DB2C08|nr:serine/threonine transporter SstT [uncultured Methanobrevibacter sp.]
MSFIQKWTESSLILKIIIGMIVGVILGIIVPQWSFIGFFGKVFVEALKSIAPLLVFILVASAISQAKTGVGSKFKIIIAIFLLMNFIAAVVATVACFIFPISIHLSAASTAASPGGLADILGGMVLKIFSNPIKSLSEGEYLGILFWSIIIGIALRMVASDTTKDLLSDIAEVFSKIVYFIIQFAPIGVMGLVFTSVCESGLSIFSQYGELIFLIVGCILIMAFIINPLITVLLIKRNPFPLVFTCFKESGVTAFFSRSSAANIPINMQLCEKLGLDRDFYSVTIPLGSTINTNGAAVTIAIMTLVACHTMGIPVHFSWAILLCVVTTLAACCASGVVGGSLLLIPLTCSLFGISQDISMQVVAVGFIISVIQDSFETALNSASDVLFTAATEYYVRAKNGEPVNYLGEFSKGD